MSISPSGFDPFLVSLGWDDFFQAEIQEMDLSNFFLARVMGQGKGHYHIQATPEKTREAAITSKFHAAVKESTDFPAVGDWVAFDPGVGSQQATIHRVLKRKSFLQRKRSGSQSDMQPIAANVDFMLIVTSCNEDFDLKRLQRYIALARDSGCMPALLLTKSDLCSNPDDYLMKLKSEFESIEAFAISSRDLHSVDRLQKFFSPGKTTVLLGSSGVGKSTLTNYLLGTDSQKTQVVSSQSKGKHTTTARSLRFTRWGGLVMDTPGMQEISEVVHEDDLQLKFSDIEELMLRCKFTTCQHKNEPGCAVQKQLKTGELKADRWAAYISAVTGPRRRR
jgi:ribosome biogenesis GTPase